MHAHSHTSLVVIVVDVFHISRGDMGSPWGLLESDSLLKSKNHV